jgi:hypothetical protein
MQGQTTELCAVTAGVIYPGSGIKFTRPRGKGGYVTVRGIDSQRRWLYCTDNRGGARVVRLGEIYWVGSPPPRQKQKDITIKRRPPPRPNRRRR